MWNDTGPNFSMNVCRLCANVSDVVIPIFGKDAEKNRLDLKIKKCLPIAVREEDFKPKQVCFNCVSKLEVCTELVDMCLKSECQFNSVLQTYTALKTVDSGQGNMQPNEESKETEIDEPSLGVVPLIQQASKQSEITSNNTLTVSHEGGVIVLSKVDTDINNQQREECQDILLMVELKYKDLPDSQQSALAKSHTITYTVDPQNNSLTKLSTQPYTVDTNKTHAISFPATVQTEAKQPTLAYSVEQPVISGGKTYTLAYSADPKVPVVTNNSAITYTSETQPIVVPKTFTYSTEHQGSSLAKESPALTYSDDVDGDKTHTLVFTEAQRIALKKESLTFSPDDVQPVALIKSNVLAYAPDHDSDVSVKNEDVFINDRSDNNCDKEHNLADVEECLQVGGKSTKILTFPTDPEIVLDENVPQELILGSPVEMETQFKESTTEASSNPKREKPFPCNVCGKSFMRRTNLNVHMAVHTQIRPHQCEQCGKRFVLKWDLTLHQRIHTGLFACEYCSKAFSVRGKLERHRRTHTGERPFPCTTCGKAFGDKRNLESHARTHSGERPFACSVCGRSFRVRSHLTDHRRVHSQDTPYTCDICGKSFKWKTNLNIHLKVHSGERFPCEECGREFGRRADLIKHQRSHTGDRPYACGICTKSYSDKAMLQKHLKSHSDHKPYSCDVCVAAAAGPVRKDTAELAAASFRNSNDEAAAGGGSVPLQMTPRRSSCPGSRGAEDTSSRLAALRQAMKQHNVDVYYIPSGDDHQSEYVAEHDKRREFITGFTGSAGDAVVTLEEAALWTDSRYYIQAERQLDCNWLLMKSGLPEVPTMLGWISSKFAAGSNVSVDPKIISYSSWSTWNNTLASSGINLILLQENLVDPIWEENGRPAYPDEPVSVLDIEFAGETWESKLTRLREELKKKEADVMVVTALDEIAWALNLRGGDIPFTPVFRSYLVVGLDWATLYLPEDKIPQVGDHLNSSTLFVKLKTYDEIWNDLPEIGKSSKKVFLPWAYSYASGASMRIYDAVSNPNVVFDTSPLLIMKDKKNEVEIKGMKWAHVKDAVALCQLLFELEKGIAAGEEWDELKVEERLDVLRSLQKDNMGASFETIAAFADNAALPHYTATAETNKIIDNSSVFMLDSGGQYRDGTTDVTRTIHLGTPTFLQKEVYTNILRGCIDLVSTTFPEGQTLSTLEILIRAPLYSLGLNYGHGSTHGIGSFLGVHEAFDTTYHAYFFGSQEPGYYQDDEFGMRLENIVTVIPTNLSFEGKQFLKFEPVTLVPYDRNLIDVDAMSDKELDWLNEYHARVLLEVGNEMKAQNLTDVYQWLLAQTAPISK